MEKHKNGPVISFKKVHERVAAATGLSLHTVSNIVNEGKLAEASGSEIVTPGTGKNRKTRKDKIVLNDIDQDVLRRKIHELYNIHKIRPSVKKLHEVLKEDIGFKGSREVLRQHLKKFGISLQKSQRNQAIINEAHECQVINNEEIEEMPTAYLEEVTPHRYTHSDQTVLTESIERQPINNEHTEKIPPANQHESYSQTNSFCHDTDTDGASNPACKRLRYIIDHSYAESEQT